MGWLTYPDYQQLACQRLKINQNPYGKDVLPW